MYNALVCGADSNVKLDNDTMVHYINFNNAGTTPPFKSVMEKLNDFSSNYSSVDRGSGYKSKICSDIYSESRRKIIDFLGGDQDYHTVVFLKNTTECINKLSYRLKPILKDKLVLTTYMEHHSNMLPWQDKYDTKFVDLDEYGRLSMDDLEKKLKYYNGKVGLLAISGASNVTGYINPIHEIADLCHKYGAKILVDGAQLIPHCSFQMGQIDFLAFSAHKMYAPFGTGALITPKEIVALTESIQTLNYLSMDKVEEYEIRLTDYTLDRMKKIPNLTIYNDNPYKKVSIISFNVKGLHHDKVAEILASEGGISVRSGCFCAQPYVQKLLNISDEDVKNHRLDKSKLPGMVRVSFGLYNDSNEVDLFIYLLEKIANKIDYYKNKYSNPPLD